MDSDLTMRGGLVPLVVTGTLCFPLALLPVLLACFGERNAAFTIGWIIALPVVLLLSIGITIRMVQVRIRRSQESVSVSIRLPRAGSVPLLPTMLHSHVFMPNEISRVDVIVRPNSAAVDGSEQLYHLRTDFGDYYFNSMWFSNCQIFDDFIAQQRIEMFVGTADEVMEKIAAILPTDPDFKACGTAVRIPSTAFGFSAAATRGCVWLISAALFLILLLGALVYFFGEPSDSRFGLLAMAIAVLGLGTVKILTSYRLEK